MKKFVLPAAIISSCLLLAGCQNNNPLLSQPKNKVVQFILKAQSYASEKTQHYDAVGSVYLDCLRNPNHFNNPFNHESINACEQIFQAMLAYAKQEKSFASLSLSDLKDKRVEEKLGKAIFFQDAS